jgi:hypothetical protein
MSDEVEKVSITVIDTRGSATRIVTDEYDVNNTKWPHLVQVFLEQLQGLGYSFNQTPANMAEILADINADAFDDEGEYPEVVEESGQKYPYYGVHQDADGITLVHFTTKDTGECVFTKGHKYNKLGAYCDNWAECLFTKVREQ